MHCFAKYTLNALAAAILVLTPRSNSIRQVDFKNFVYPWEGGGSPPEHWHWIGKIPSTTVALSDGTHRFLEDAEPGQDPRWVPALWINSITYGNLDRDQEEEAAVVLQYSTGGTANWSYLYVYKLDQGNPKLLAWLESGSRADGGLVNVAIQNGQLVAEFADSERRIADCCSKGFIRVRYAWKDHRFVENGKREKGDLEIEEHPLK